MYKVDGAGNIERRDDSLPFHLQTYGRSTYTLSKCILSTPKTPSCKDISNRLAPPPYPSSFSPLK